MSKVTGEQVMAAVVSAGLDYIDHHDCGICGSSVFYSVVDGNLYFNPGCGCSWSPPEQRTWESAADWINMQDNDSVRTKIKAKFGMLP